VGDLVEEGEQFAVALLDAAHLARGEEALAEEANGPLDATLLVGLSDVAGPQADAVRAGQVDELRVEAHRAAVALGHHNLRVVEQPLPGAATEVRRRAREAAQERVDREVEDEFAPHRPAPGEQHHKEPQGALAAGHAHLADVRPVDLREAPIGWLRKQWPIGYRFVPGRPLSWPLSLEEGPDHCRSVRFLGRWA